MTVKRLRITGVVQGVGYRAWFGAQARSLDLSGWIRNRRDGSVEAVVSGQTEAIVRISEKARRGPPAAAVSDVSVTDDDGASIVEGIFEQLPTA